MNRKRFFLIVEFALLVVLLWTLLRVSKPDYEVRYTVMDLGTLRGDFSSPVTINNRGHVAGIWDTYPSRNHAFLWTLEEGMKDIGQFYPQRMNDRDEVVGFIRRNNIQHACLWSPTDGLVDLGTLGGLRSEAYSINNRSEVVGSITNNIARSGFVWTATDGVRLLSDEWVAYDINDAGEILCSGASDKTTEPYFVYSLTRSDIIPSEGRTASLMLPLRVVRSEKLSQGGEIFYHLPFCDLESEFPIPMEEGYQVFVNHSNGAEIVGSVCYLSPLIKKAMNMKWLPKFLVKPLGQFAMRLQDARAVLWKGEETLDLTNHIQSDNGWRCLIEATDINELGQITGIGTIDGEYHAFLLTPIEESRENDG